MWYHFRIYEPGLCRLANAEYRSLSRNERINSMKSLWFLAAGLAAISVAQTVSAQKTPPPAPYGALPSERQQKWHEMETYAFLHFTTNTFTDKEWGYGDEDPKIFHPTAFDPDQIVRTLKAAGMKGVRRGQAQFSPKRPLCTGGSA